jgi:hypothetical protein
VLVEAVALSDPPLDRLRLYCAPRVERVSAVFGMKLGICHGSPFLVIFNCCDDINHQVRVEALRDHAGAATHSHRP